MFFIQLTKLIYDLKTKNLFMIFKISIDNILESHVSVSQGRLVDHSDLTAPCLPSVTQVPMPRLLPLPQMYGLHGLNQNTQR